MAILNTLHRALIMAQMDDRIAPLLRYLLLHALRPLLADVNSWLLDVLCEVSSLLYDRSHLVCHYDCR
jgi:hypothetical protein